jgi:tetratricopeptide (TPR) repeat protein
MADTSAAATTPARPLPIGAFELPFGFLLLPAGPDTELVRQALLAGRLPAQWPTRLRGHQAALEGDLDAALAVFAGPDPVSRFNRFVIDPDAAAPDELRKALGHPLGILVDLVLFATGRSDTVPDPASCDGELSALLLAGVAVQALTEVPPSVSVSPNGAVVSPAPVALLRQAVAVAQPVSPALAGVLHGALAQACKESGDPGAAIAALEAGIGLLSGTDLDTGRAEQHLELAATYHELALGQPALVAKAVHHYHCALQDVSPQRAPEVFAAAHAGLAAAYLTMPMTEASDQLRLGVAVGSLRAALTVYTPRTHPAEWSSAQLNLANALVYAPSAHRAGNLKEAVELYEAVLSARSRAHDPVGYARALANQGNALAHLGMFDEAHAKLAEARVLFEESQDWDAVASVRELLDEIGRRRREHATARTVTDGLVSLHGIIRPAPAVPARPAHEPHEPAATFIPLSSVRRRDETADELRDGS